MTDNPQSVDLMNYETLTADALRQVMVLALERMRSEGLPGQHHFYITFHTYAQGVEVHQHLRDKYPETITIVMQHQYDHLVVESKGFEVTLHFGGVPRRLKVPWDAVSRFYDPSVQFLLQWPEPEIVAPEPVAAVAENTEDNVVRPKFGKPRQ